MFRRPFDPDRFLQALAGTGLFRDYCRSRGLGDVTNDAPDRAGRTRRWEAIVRRIPPVRRAVIERELRQVNDLATRAGLTHLLAACDGHTLPPERLPGATAPALWVLLHRPDVFQEVFFHAEDVAIGTWHHAWARPGIELRDHAPARAAAFAAALQAFVRRQEGRGRFCVVRARRDADTASWVFIGWIADRPRPITGFTTAGQPRTWQIRPATRVTCVYDPADGTVLLQSRFQAPEQVHTLLRAFADTVLGTRLDERRLGRTSDLDRLREPFDPPLEEGITAVRVKAIELAYPAAHGRRRIRLETNVADGPQAIPELMARHLGPLSERDRLRVLRADLQVTFRGGGCDRTVIIRLWPDRSSLGRTPTAARLRACLIRWGLFHAP